MSRHQNPSMVNLRDGHLNLVLSGHYNFAITGALLITGVMVNQHGERKNTTDLVGRFMMTRGECGYKKNV